MMQNNPHDGDDAELDRLIGQARWGQPTAAQLDRLKEHWQNARRRRRNVLGSSAVAACSVLSIAWLGWQSIKPSAPTITARPIAIDVSPLAPAVDRTLAALSSIEPSSPLADERIVGRDPNVFERVVMSGAPRRSRPSRTRMSDEALERAVDDSITTLQNDATAELKDHLPSGSRDRAWWEQRLWTIVQGPQGERRQAATRLLAQVATVRSVPILLESADDPATHEVVVLALGRLLQADELSRLAAIEPDAALQQRLFTMLLERRAPEAIEVFLTCVNDRNLHAPALAAVACMSDPPHDQLLPFIEHPQGKLRLAAAQALAELSNPEVARRLTAFAMDGIGRQEAWIALLLSRSVQASNFVNRARGDLYFVASIRAAESQIQSLGTQRGGQVP